MADLVTIATFDNDFAANIALTKLQANDIRAILDNALLSEVWNLPGASYTTISLLVNACDADKARQVLEL